MSKGSSPQDVFPSADRSYAVSPISRAEPKLMTARCVNKLNKVEPDSIPITTVDKLGKET